MNTPPDLRDHNVRLVEAMLFASAEPVSEPDLKARLADDVDLAAVLDVLATAYTGRGVELVKVGRSWAFRTAADLGRELRGTETQIRKLSRAGLETLSIIAYHQPITRGELEEIRGVSFSKGTLDVLLEAGWIRPGKRRLTPGRPLTWITTEAFLDHFALEGLEDLPGLADLKAAGLLDRRPGLGIAMRAEDAAEGPDDGDLDTEEPLPPLDGEDGRG